MKYQRTWQQYRNIDLGMFALMLTVCEFVIVFAANFWFRDQLYTVSVAGAVVSIVYMRWGAWGGIHAALAGLVYSYFAGGSAAQLVIYSVGNLASLLAVPVLLALGKERVRKSPLGLLFPAAVQLLMQAGRAGVALLLGAAPPEVIGFFTKDSLSLLFTVVIVWIAKRLDGIYEDQKHYLLRIQDNNAEGTKKGGIL